MKKSLILALILGLLAGSVAAPATAKKKAKAVKTTFFLHGTYPVDEANANEAWLNDAWPKMDTNEPTEATPKSQFITNYFRGPNTDCDGNGLLGTVWKGNLAGTVKGDVKLTLHTLATPAVEMVASLYADPTGTCAAAETPGVSEAVEAPQPAAQEQVAIAPGPGVTEIVFKNVNLKAMGSMLVQLHIPSQTTPGQVRILYDAVDYASSIEFKCIPASGKSCV